MIKKVKYMLIFTIGLIWIYCIVLNTIVYLIRFLRCLKKISKQNGSENINIFFWFIIQILLKLTNL